MSPSGSQGTQCVHQDFSSRCRHRYIPAERIHVCIPGHTGWILGSYLRDIFQPRHSSFVVMTQLENRMSQPCLTDSISQVFEFIQPWLIKISLPMGVIMLPEASLALYLSSIHWKNIVGCAPSALDGRSPRGYSQKSIISSIGSNVLCLLLIIKSKLCMIISSGACPALPIVVAPESIVEYFRL
jgi:hypothetical protein